MNPFRSLRRAMGQRTGMRVLRFLPRGVDVFYDLKYLLPGHRTDLIVDVGANVGQSALRYVSACPKARIISLEPVNASFEKLRAATAGEERVQCFRFAVSDHTGELDMLIDGDPSMNRVASAGSTGATERVPCITLDHFLQTRRVDRVNYLKVDTEGAERSVLAGCSDTLRAQRIDLVELEAGMSATNELHVPLHELEAHLATLGYVLFGLYDQLHEWPGRDPALRRVNAVFISDRLRQSYRGRVPAI